jgi:hypothetical protein
MSKCHGLGYLSCLLIFKEDGDKVTRGYSPYCSNNSMLRSWYAASTNHLSCDFCVMGGCECHMV